MKISLLFTLCLFSGPVSCYDVVGYSGGAVRIYCVHQTNKTVNTYFCKMKPWTCTFPERVSVISSRHYVAVEYKNLRLQDAGLYQCGDAGVWNHSVNLTVTQDPCCSGPKTVTGYLGETVTISCSYPDQYKENVKNLQKQYGQYFTEVIDTEKTQRDRFSISEDRRSKAVSVRISDVKEDDGGVYYCGVWLGGGAVIYFSLYSEIQLQVTGKKTTTWPNKATPASSSATVKPTLAAYRTTSTAPTPSIDEEHLNSSIIIIITVCACVVLLLIGGFTLIFYRLRCRRTQVRTCKGPETNSTDDGVYETYRTGEKDNISMDVFYQNDDAVYETYLETGDKDNISMDVIYQNTGLCNSQLNSIY